MSNFLSGFLDNAENGLQNPKGTLGDFQHAAKLYNDTYFRLAPKVKFLYHVVLNINPNVIANTPFRQQDINTINLLVKSADLPKYKLDVETKHQYNRKKNVQTGINYEPVNITFHDDNAGITTMLWSLYYGYYFADTSHNGSVGAGNKNSTTDESTGILDIIGSFVPSVAKAIETGNRYLNPNKTEPVIGASPAAYQNNTYLGTERNGFRYGLDNSAQEPFFNSIQIYQLSRQEFQCFTLVNPMVTNWSHDTMEQGDDSGVVQSSMTLAYETVFYNQGYIEPGINPRGFASEYYDQVPSMLQIQGGGTRSVFGEGGVASGLSDIFGNISSGNAFKDLGSFIGTIRDAKNVYENAQDISKGGLREEGIGILNQALGSLAAGKVSAINNIFVPKYSGVGSTPSSPPPEPSNKNVDPSSAFSSLSAKDPRAANAAMADIAKKANIPGVPTTADGFNKLSGPEKEAAREKISNEYRNGNPKVVNMTNKIGGAQ